MPEVDLSGLNTLAAAVIRESKPGTVVWLSGDLGSGKTAFVRAAVDAVHGEPASSPTYALVHEYDTPIGSLIHVDCYRLIDPEEAIDIDFPELLRAARALFVEWPERAGGYAPEPDVHLQFAHVERSDHRLVERVR